MDDMIYKGYTGNIRYNYFRNFYHGRVLFIDDIISYEGETQEECRKDFERAVDFYLEMKVEEKK
jgi:predicted HicB family RNase H-like nuclease